MQNDMSDPPLKAAETTAHTDLGTQVRQPPPHREVDLRSMTHGQLQELMRELGQPASGCEADRGVGLAQECLVSGR